MKVKETVAVREELTFTRLEFIQGVARLDQLPCDEGAEVAFGGRSNAGKSSAINAIARRRALARISKTPGRTQQINFFRLDDRRRLVDLPGYGFARAPGAAQRHWGRLVEGCLRRRRSLAGMVLLVDIRRGLMDMDQQMLAWCASRGLPLQVVMTKSDKLSRSRAAAALATTRGALSSIESPWDVQLLSAPRREGVDLLSVRLCGWLALDGEAG